MSIPRFHSATGVSKIATTAGIYENEKLLRADEPSFLWMGIWSSGKVFVSYMLAIGALAVVRKVVS